MGGAPGSFAFKADIEEKRKKLRRINRIFDKSGHIGKN